MSTSTFQFIQQTPPVWSWSSPASSISTSERWMLQRDKDGWWRWVRLKLEHWTLTNTEVNTVCRLPCRDLNHSSIEIRSQDLKSLKCNKNMYFMLSLNYKLLIQFREKLQITHSLIYPWEFNQNFISQGPDCLKTKMSELRLYCDLLVQQVQTIQSQHSTDTEPTDTSEVKTQTFIWIVCHIYLLVSWRQKRY